MEKTEIVVVGAGLIGATIAWNLARRGHRVVLVDRGEPGAEASSAAVGGLQPEAKPDTDQSLLQLWTASLAGYTDFVEDVRAATGAAFEYRLSGHLHLAFDDADDQSLRKQLADQVRARIHCEYLSGDDVRRLEPALSPAVCSALHYSGHGFVDNQRLSPAVVTAAAMAGVTVRSHEPVLSIASSGSRIDGVQTSRGQIAADVVVNAAGAWSASLVPTVTQYLSEVKGKSYLYQYRRSPSGATPENAESQEPAVVRPMKGEVVALQTLTRRFEHSLTVAGGTIVPRADGRVIVGGTIADVGFDKTLTAAGVGELVEAAIGAIPDLASARFLEAWTGLRPRSLDDRPLIGADRIAGFYWATGHYRMGILAAPITAEIIADLIEGRTPSIAIESMSPRRFGL